MRAPIAAAADEIKRLRLQVAELEKVLKAARSHICHVAGWFRLQRCKVCIAVNAYEKSQARCPSTYTHSTLGKLTCEKDERHLHRVGDVEHVGHGVKWMSV